MNEMNIWFLFEKRPKLVYIYFWSDYDNLNIGNASY